MLSWSGSSSSTISASSTPASSARAPISSSNSEMGSAVLSYVVDSIWTGSGSSFALVPSRIKFTFVFASPKLVIPYGAIAFP